MKITIVFLIGASIILLIKGLKLGLKRLSLRNSSISLSDNMFSAIVLIIWLGYIFWATDLLLRDKFYFPYLVYALIFVAIALISWFLLRDIFSGIIFRAKHNLKTDTYIKAGEFSGKIKSQHLTYLKLMTADGQLIRVPYTLLISEVITELAFPGSLDEHIIRIHSDPGAGNANQVESLIRNVVLNTPWSNINEEPTIRFIKEDDNGCIFEVTLLSINVNQMKYIEMALEKVAVFQVVS